MRKLHEIAEEFKIEHFDHMRISGRHDGMSFEAVIKEPDFHCTILRGDETLYFDGYINPVNLRLLSAVREHLEEETKEALLLAKHGHPGDRYEHGRKTLEDYTSPWKVSEVEAFLQFMKKRDDGLRAAGGDPDRNDLNTLAHAALRELGIPLAASEGALNKRQGLEARAAKLTEHANAWLTKAKPEERILAACECIARRTFKTNHRPGLTDVILGNISATFEVGERSLGLATEQHRKARGVQRYDLLGMTKCMAESLAASETVRDHFNYAPDPSPEDLANELVAIVKEHGVTPEFVRQAIKMKLEQDSTPSPSL